LAFAKAYQDATGFHLKHPDLDAAMAELKLYIVVARRAAELLAQRLLNGKLLLQQRSKSAGIILSLRFRDIRVQLALATLHLPPAQRLDRGLNKLLGHLV